MSAQNAAPDKAASDVSPGNANLPRVPELRPFGLRREVKEAMVHFSRRRHRIDPKNLLLIADNLGLYRSAMKTTK